MNLLDATVDLFKANRRTCGEYRYTVPSPESYPYQWLWDSCFHAIILTHFDLNQAKDELRSLVSAQHKNGLLPHIVYWEPTEILNINWGTPGTSSLTQPPIIAYATKRVLDKTNDIEFLREIYPALKRYTSFLLTRDGRKNNIVSIINPDESGEDNSPRFDIPLGVPGDISAREHFAERRYLFERNRLCNFEPLCMKEFFWVKDLPFNIFLLESLRIMADFAELLGNKQESTEFKRQAMKTEQAIMTHMKGGSLFYSVFGNRYNKIATLTWAQFAPMLTHSYTHQEASHLVSHYLANESYFHSPHGVPTTSKSDVCYSPEEPAWGKAWQHPNWRGPIWMATNWFVVRGLRNYGFDEEAERIAAASRELISQEGFREYFHPNTGEGLGSHNFTWGGLALDM